MDHVKTFAETIYDIYADKFVEIYCGNTKAARKFAEEDTSCKELIRGYVRGASEYGLILECEIGQSSKMVVVNSFSIQTVMEVDKKDINSIKTKDVFWNEQDNHKFHTS